MNEGNRLATKLKELRKAHSYTQDYVAETLGIVRQTYSHYETGKRTRSFLLLLLTDLSVHLMSSSLSTLPITILLTFPAKH